MNKSEREIIIPINSDRQLTLEAQQQIERLQRHCLVELSSVREFQIWLDDKRSCRQG